MAETNNAKKSLFASDELRGSPFDLSVLYLDIMYCRLYRNTRDIRLDISRRVTEKWCK